MSGIPAPLESLGVPRARPAFQPASEATADSGEHRGVKQALADLALFGGSPAFATPLHVGAPNIGDRERLHALLDDILDRRWLTNDGRLVQRFERELADFLQVEYCVSTCNATSALMLFAAAMGLRGEVIVPALTFPATVHAMRWQGLQPVFCDVEESTLTLSATAADSLITSSTSAVLGVHLWGTPCDVDALAAVAVRHGVELFFDAAHAFGCRFAGRPLGCNGAAEAFSFHATKLCNAFEGGAVATTDPELAREVALLRNFGFADVDRVERLGINAKMHEASAAMGLVSLASVEEFAEVNRLNHDRYAAGLREVEGIGLRMPDPVTTPTYPYVVVEVFDEFLRRDLLLVVLQAENVLARRYFYPGVHRMEPYRSTHPNASEQLPVTERVLERIMLLPTGTATSPEAIDEVCDLIRFASLNAPRIASRYGQSE